MLHYLRCITVLIRYRKFTLLLGSIEEGTWLNRTVCCDDSKQFCGAYFYLIRESSEYLKRLEIFRYPFLPNTLSTRQYWLPIVAVSERIFFPSIVGVFKGPLYDLRPNIYKAVYADGGWQHFKGLDSMVLLNVMVDSQPCGWWNLITYSLPPRTTKLDTRNNPQHLPAITRSTSRVDMMESLLSPAMMSDKPTGMKDFKVADCTRVLTMGYRLSIDVGNCLSCQCYRADFTSDSRS